jgi:lipopolysaccharide/colanic/teichoic acid biosynthesis glycosyltransferase
VTRFRASLILLCFDAAATAFVFNAVLVLRNSPAFTQWLVGPLLVPYLACLVALYLVDGYRLQTDFLGADYLSQHAIALLAALVATLLLTFVVSPFPTELNSSRLLIGLSFVALIPVTLSYRRVLRLRFLARRGERTLVFVGDAPSRAAFHEECVQIGEHQPVLYAHPTADAAESDTCLTTIHLETLLTALEADQRSVDALILHEQSTRLSETTARRILRLNLRGIPSSTLQHFYEMHWRRIPLSHLSSTWIFNQGFDIAREPVTERIKRMSDLFLSGIGLLVATPIVAVAALAVWLEDRRSPLFFQTRIGRNGVPFRIMKLRTMRVAQGDLYTAKGDNRITQMGGFLRKSRLDEVPQLWNVFKGDMSLIGPRCEWDQLVARYEKEIPYYHFRHLVKPGITGCGAGELSLRRQSGGHAPQARIRPLLYSQFFVHA